MHIPGPQQPLQGQRVKSEAGFWPSQEQRYRTAERFGETPQRPSHSGLASLLTITIKVQSSPKRSQIAPSGVLEVWEVLGRPFEIAIRNQEITPR